MSTTDLPGSSLLAGRYRLVERLGAGGMSVVWRGFDEVLGRQVAVKVLPPSTSTDPSFRRRLRAEAQAAARLSHPHITNVYDYGEAITVDGEPVPYVVMELVDGESLAAVLARSRRLPWPAAVRISSEVSAALAAAHARGIVHRDVTPANVMLTPSGAKVVDFGISALIGENDIDPDGSLLGTPAYLAPERLEGGQVSPATDVYAVGLLIYRTLIGQLPWDVGTTTALLRAHQYTEPEPLPHVEGLPPAVEALVARCLEKRPADRPSSAELAHVLAGVAASTPSSRGFVPDWADSSEDTTILPSALPDTGGIRRARHGQASVAEVAQPGRGVAARGAAAAGPGQVSRISDAPISPAPGSAVPVSISEVEAAMGGRRAADRVAAPAPSSRPSQGGGRNSRFASAPRSAASAVQPAAAAPAVPAAARGPAAPPSGNAVLRPAYGADNARVAGPRKPAGPPPNRPPVPPDRTGGDPGKGRSGSNQGRRVLVVAGLVALLGGGTYAASLASVNSKPPSTAGPSVVPVSDKCVVSYTVWSDNGKQFKASVSVANRDSAPIKNWKLWFLMPGDQIMTGKGKQQLTQEQGAVTVSSETALAPQATNTMQITGRYKEDNHPPMVFKLAGRTCETYVSGKPGAPSQPVEHLSDDTTRLGPVPSTKVPAPGLSTGPGGVIVPVPVKTAAAPGASTPAPLSATGPTSIPSASPTGPPPDPGPGTIGGGGSTATPSQSSSALPGPAPTTLFTSSTFNPVE